MLQITPNGQWYDRCTIHFNINKPLSGIVKGGNQHDFFCYDESGINEI